MLTISNSREKLNRVEPVAGRSMNDNRQLTQTWYYFDNAS